VGPELIAHIEASTLTYPDDTVLRSNLRWMAVVSKHPWMQCRLMRFDSSVKNCER
jgi:hypothetical protein